MTVEPVPSMCRALGPTPSIKRKEKEKEKKKKDLSTFLKICFKIIQYLFYRVFIILRPQRILIKLENK